MEEVADAVPEEGAVPTLNEGRAMNFKWRCQVDASWKDKEEGASMGFVLFEENQAKLIGVRKGGCVPSPMHAEAEALCWAMKETRRLGATEVYFESDCQHLVRLIQTRRNGRPLARNSTRSTLSVLNSLPFLFALFAVMIMSVQTVFQRQVDHEYQAFVSWITRYHHG